MHTSKQGKSTCKRSFKKKNHLVKDYILVLIRKIRRYTIFDRSVVVLAISRFSALGLGGEIVKTQKLLPHIINYSNLCIILWGHSELHFVNKVNDFAVFSQKPFMDHLRYFPVGLSRSFFLVNSFSHRIFVFNFNSITDYKLTKRKYGGARILFHLRALCLNL